MTFQFSFHNWALVLSSFYRVVDWVVGSVVNWFVDWVLDWVVEPITSRLQRQGNSNKATGTRQQWKYNSDNSAEKNSDNATRRNHSRASRNCLILIDAGSYLHITALHTVYISLWIKEGVCICQNWGGQKPHGEITLESR